MKAGKVLFFADKGREIQKIVLVPTHNSTKNLKDQSQMLAQDWRRDLFAFQNLPGVSAVQTKLAVINDAPICVEHGGYLDRYLSFSVSSIKLR